MEIPLTTHSGDDLFKTDSVRLARLKQQVIQKQQLQQQSRPIEQQRRQHQHQEWRQQECHQAQVTYTRPRCYGENHMDYGPPAVQRSRKELLDRRAEIMMDYTCNGLELLDGIMSFFERIAGKATSKIKQECYPNTWNMPSAHKVAMDSMEAALSNVKFERDLLFAELTKPQVSSSEHDPPLVITPQRIARMKMAKQDIARLVEENRKSVVNVDLKKSRPRPPLSPSLALSPSLPLSPPSSKPSIKSTSSNSTVLNSEGTMFFSSKNKCNSSPQSREAPPKVIMKPHAISHKSSSSPSKSSPESQAGALERGLISALPKPLWKIKIEEEIQAKIEQRSKHSKATSPNRTTAQNKKSSTKFIANKEQKCSTKFIANKFIANSSTETERDRETE